MLEELKEKVYRANVELFKLGLVIYTWGNVSGFDPKKELVVIKPSGVAYDQLRPDDMVVLDLHGNRIDGTLNPSSDTRTHLELYRAFPELGGIVHTHSTYAVAWAQSGRDIPCYGTTHADYFYGCIPCTRMLTEEEVAEDYEGKTGQAIIETMKGRKMSVADIPGVICNGHGPFAWGKSAAEAVFHASVLEQVSQMALFTYQLNPMHSSLPSYICDKHFLRKHGTNAYYGQRST